MNSIDELLLVEVALHINDYVSGTNNKARLGSDEITIALTELNPISSVEVLVQEIDQSLVKPCHIKVEKMSVTHLARVCEFALLTHYAFN